MSNVPRQASHFDYLSSIEAEIPSGVWGWAKRLIDALRRFRPFEIMDVPLIDKPFYLMRVKEDGDGWELVPSNLALIAGEDLTSDAGFVVRVNATEDGFEITPEVMHSLRGVSLAGKAGQFVKVNATENGFTIAP